MIGMDGGRASRNYVLLTWLDNDEIKHLSTTSIILIVDKGAVLKKFRRRNIEKWILKWG